MVQTTELIIIIYVKTLHVYSFKGETCLPPSKCPDLNKFIQIHLKQIVICNYFLWKLNYEYNRQYNVLDLIYYLYRLNYRCIGKFVIAVQYLYCIVE